MYVRVSNGHYGAIRDGTMSWETLFVVWWSSCIVCSRSSSTVQSNGTPLSAEDNLCKVALPATYAEAIFTFYVELVSSRRHDGAGIV